MNMPHSEFAETPFVDVEPSVYAIKCDLTSAAESDWCSSLTSGGSFSSASAVEIVILRDFKYRNVEDILKPVFGKFFFSPNF